MGRKRLDEDKKKKDIKLSLSKWLIDDMKNKKINISALVEKLLKEYFKK